MANKRFIDGDGTLPPNYFKEWRDFNGLTQAEVEKIFGWPASRLSNLENRRAPFSPHILTALARLYKCPDIGDLLSRPPPPGRRGDNAVASGSFASHTAIGALSGGDHDVATVGGIGTMRVVVAELKNKIDGLRSTLVPGLDEMTAQLDQVDALAENVLANAQHLGELFKRFLQHLRASETGKSDPDDD